MGQIDPCTRRFETVECVHGWSECELLRVGRPGTEDAGWLVFVPPRQGDVAREIELLELLDCPGVPRLATSPQADASRLRSVALAGCEDARPLALYADVPPATLRDGLVQMLSVLSHAHSRGVIHGGPSADTVLATPSGEFFLVAWYAARSVEDEALVPSAFRPVTRDLRALARTFRDALIRATSREGDQAAHGAPVDSGGVPPDGSMQARESFEPGQVEGLALLPSAGIDRDFSRVLSRLLSDDPRQVYGDADEVLCDLGESNRSIPDPWEEVPAVGLQPTIDLVLSRLDDTGLEPEEGVRHVASVDVVGPPGSGRTRALREIARAARARGHLVILVRGDDTTGSGASRAVDGAGPGPHGAAAGGGLASLVRQTLHLASGDSAAHGQHQEFLAYWLREKSATQPAGGGGDAGARSGPSALEQTVPRLTAAVSDLVTEVFADRPAVLLMDDEHHLPSTARAAWRGLGRYVQALNESGRKVRVQLVSARDAPASSHRPTSRPHEDSDEIGSTREVVDLVEWDRAQVAEYLQGVVTESDVAASVAAVTHAMAGGLPLDVVHYLRELERLEILERRRSRWILRRHPTELPRRTGRIAQQSRRALERCGHDARRLVEVIVVANGIELTRQVCGRLAELSGPLLWRAADEAQAAGLLVRERSSWRVRTEGIRRRLYSAMADSRRRELHKELLVHLEETDADNFPALATHARATNHQRAEEWTMAAVERLREAGDYDGAIEQVEDVIRRSCVDSPRTARECLLAELNRTRGTVAEAISVLDRVVADQPEARRLTPAVSVLLAEYCYEMRDWQRVLSVELPLRRGTPEQLATVRLFRALAYAQQLRVRLARRELRLADAEFLVEPPSAIWDVDRLLADALVRLSDGDLVSSRIAYLSAARRAASVNDRFRVCRAVAGLANVERRLERPASARAIAEHVATRIRLLPGEPWLLDAVNSTTIALIDRDVGDPSAAARTHQRLYSLHLRHGEARYALAHRLREIFARMKTCTVGPADSQFVARTGAELTRLEFERIADLVNPLGTVLAHFGHVEDLRILVEKVDASAPESRLFDSTRRTSRRARMWILDPADVVLPNGRMLGDAYADGVPSREAIDAADSLALRFERFDFDHVHPLEIHAFWIRSGTWRPRGISECRDLVAVARKSRYEWARFSLALALALWCSDMRHRALQDELHRIVSEAKGECPSPLRWQVLLLTSVVRLDEGDFVGANRLEKEARRLLRALLAGLPAGRRVLLAASVRLLRRKAWTTLTSDTSARLDAPKLLRQGQRVQASLLMQVLSRRWGRSLESARRHSRIFVQAYRAKEAELFAELVRFECGSVRIVTDASCDDLHSGLRGRLVLLEPQAWSLATVRTVQALMPNQQRTGGSVIVVSSASREQVRRKGDAYSAVMDLVRGAMTSIDNPCSDPEHRADVFLAVLDSVDPSIAVLPEVVRAIEKRDWNGGVREVVDTCVALVELQLGEISLHDVARIGWFGPCSTASGASLLEHEIVATVDASAVALSSRCISDRVRRPRRTVQRALARLRDAGVLRRLGNGPSALYVR